MSEWSSRVIATWLVEYFRASEIIRVGVSQGVKCKAL